MENDIKVLNAKLLEAAERLQVSGAIGETLIIVAASVLPPDQFASLSTKLVKVIDQAEAEINARYQARVAA
jgi:hypothetical protein